MPRRLRRSIRPAALPRLITSVGLALSVVAGITTLGERVAAGQATPPPTEQWWLSLPRVTMPVPSDGASVVIVKFTDYQCPQCGVSHRDDGPVLAKYQRLYPGKIKFVSKDYPLQPDCNAAVSRPMHPAACDAAVAVRLARERGTGDLLEDYFYSHQPLLTPATVREYATTVGGVRDFDAQYQRALAGVKADISLARLLGIHSTPTFFVNGAAIVGAIAPEYLDFAIAYELKKAGVAK